MQAEAACSEGHNLKQSAGHGDVLEEVDELVLIRKITVERKRRRKSEACEPCRNEPRAIARDQCKAA